MEEPKKGVQGICQFCQLNTAAAGKFHIKESKYIVQKARCELIMSTVFIAQIFWCNACPHTVCSPELHLEEGRGPEKLTLGRR